MKSEDIANPAPLGLLGFGMTTILLNMKNAGILDTTTSLGMIFAMGIFYGGLAQVIAGLQEFKKGNTFGATAFSSYGLFWLTFVALNVFPSMNPAWAEPVDKLSMAAYLFCWGVFTALMFIGTLKTNLVLQFVFLSLALLFFLLAIADFLIYSDIELGSTIAKIAGLEGIICGSSAFYLAIAEIIGWPIFPVNSK